MNSVARASILDVATASAGGQRARREISVQELIHFREGSIIAIAFIQAHRRVGSCGTAGEHERSLTELALELSKSAVGAYKVNPEESQSGYLGAVWSI